MNTFKRLTIIFLITLISACGSKSNQKKTDFIIKTNAIKGDISINETLKITLENKKKHTIDSVFYTLDGKSIKEATALNDFKLGKHTLEAKVYFNNTEQTVNTSITLLNGEAPKIYTFKIINEYPHDITSYTQGIEFFDNNLYESTGQYKESKLRRVNYKTGEVLKNINLADEYFGEGLTILNDKIYQLTWQEGTGFVYDVSSFDKLSSFKYGNSKEGWGLCNNDTVIYKSDGTEKIWTLDPNTLTEQGFIQVYTNKGKIGRINELEWIDGKIYANIYQKDGVAIINPKNGAVIAVIDFSSLKKKVTQHEKLDVLNGIAHNSASNTIFVTGKRWDKLFEVEIIKE
ncbi:glutaminyl-peptide cyclotransferase [Snuella lapsa]|uniref:Glutaminyl-peptide cyclotransferase n=1 Tax=Snuella lapsa TaxID=870481 RepID=A0ABP6YBG5_9FLAO